MEIKGGEPIKKHDIVFSSDSKEEALSKGHELFPSDPSGWTYYSFDIDINTLTDLGKELYKEFKEDFDKFLEEAKQHPEKYTQVTFENGIEMFVVKCPEYDKT